MDQPNSNQGFFHKNCPISKKNDSFGTARLQFSKMANFRNFEENVFHKKKVSVDFTNPFSPSVSPSPLGNNGILIQYEKAKFTGLGKIEPVQFRFPIRKDII